MLAASRAPAWGAAVAVPVRITEPAGVTRHGAPVTVGIPLPRGALTEPRKAWVGDPHGGPTPVQTEVLERWSDGSIRWLLVDFLADVPANGDSVYTLRQGTGPRPPSGPRVRLESRGGRRVINTGALRLTVPANGAALASTVEAGERRVAGTIPLPTLEATGGGAGEPTAQAVSVETEGPVRTELLFRGRWGNGATYEARLAAFAGQPVLRLRYTLTDMGDAPYLEVRRLAIVVPGAFRAGALGVGGEARRFDPLEAAHTLRQADATSGALDGAPARRADCWAEASASTAHILLATPACWQQYPQQFAVAPSALRLDLLAGGSEPLLLGRGAAKTHEVWLAFEPASGATGPRDLAAALTAPLVGQVDPRWVVRTDALAQSLAPSDDGADTFLRRLTDAFRRYQARVATERWDDGPPVGCDERKTEHPRTGFYGAFNWGDWNFPGYRDRTKGCDAWGNLEYDLPQVLGLGWVATGKRQFWDGFVAAILHYRDVDIIHHDPEHPDRVGLNHPHKVLHFAPEATQNVDLGHVWLEGLITHYRLTGERRSLEAARAMGDSLASRVGKARNPRQFGWPMIALVALAEATNEERYRDGAAHFAGAALGAYDPTPAAEDWKIGILADGLAAVQGITGDRKLLDWLTRYSDALVAAPPDRYPDARYALPLGFMAVRTGQRRYRDRALAVAADLQIGDWGKPLALGGRTGFRLLGPLAAQDAARGGPPGVTPAPAAPPPGSARGRQRR